MHRKNQGITLVAVIITTIILLILAGIVINIALGENGLLIRSKEAEGKHTKEEAIEKINLKITNIQIATYTKEQRLPSLQEMANGLCLDSEIEYVLLKSKSTAALETIVVGENKSIFTKIKDYQYEFEINSKLQLASIDGIKVSNEDNTKGKKYVSEEVREMLDAVNEIVEIEDVITPSFYKKVAEDKASAEKILSLIIQETNAEEILLRIGASVVPILSNNSNILVSSQYKNSYYGYYAFDNSNSSYWCTAYNQQNNAYLGYDFQDNKIVYLVGIGNGNFNYGSTERCKDVVLQYSDDNTTWINASDIITLEDNNNYTYIWNTKESNKHRYWRICTVSSYGSYCSIYKMRFYGI